VQRTLKKTPNPHQYKKEHILKHDGPQGESPGLYSPYWSSLIIMKNYPCACLIFLNNHLRGKMKKKNPLHFCEGQKGGGKGVGNPSGGMGIAD